MTQLFLKVIGRVTTKFVHMFSKVLGRVMTQFALFERLSGSQGYLGLSGLPDKQFKLY